MLDCLLANPAVAFNGHANLLPFVFRFESLTLKVWETEGRKTPSFRCLIRFFILR